MKTNLKIFSVLLAPFVMGLWFFQGIDDVKENILELKLFENKVSGGNKIGNMQVEWVTKAEFMPPDSCSLFIKESDVALEVKKGTPEKASDRPLRYPAHETVIDFGKARIRKSGFIDCRKKRDYSCSSNVDVFIVLYFDGNIVKERSVNEDGTGSKYEYSSFVNLKAKADDDVEKAHKELKKLSQMCAKKAGLPDTRNGVSINGVYFQKKANPRFNSYTFARFYEDGTVTKVSTAERRGGDEVVDFIKALKKKDNKFQKDKYTLHGNQVKFSSPSEKGAVHYQGTIKNYTLTLKWKSDINQREGVDVLEFIPFPPD